MFEKLGLAYEHETFGRRSKVESVFSSYKQREIQTFCIFKQN